MKTVCVLLLACTIVAFDSEPGNTKSLCSLFKASCSKVLKGPSIALRNKKVFTPKSGSLSRATTNAFVAKRTDFPLSNSGRYSTLSTALGKPNQFALPRNHREAATWKKITQDPKTGHRIRISVKDPRFVGWEKRTLPLKTKNGRVEFHWMHDAKNGMFADIKIKEIK